MTRTFVVQYGPFPESELENMMQAATQTLEGLGTPKWLTTIYPPEAERYDYMANHGGGIEVVLSGEADLDTEDDEFRAYLRSFEAGMNSRLDTRWFSEINCWEKFLDT